WAWPAAASPKTRRARCSGSSPASSTTSRGRPAAPAGPVRVLRQVRDRGLIGLDRFLDAVAGHAADDADVVDDHRGAGGERAELLVVAERRDLLFPALREAKPGQVAAGRGEQDDVEALDPARLDALAPPAD